MPTVLAQAQLEWIAACLAYSGDECLFWPFKRLNGGYGHTTRLDGKQHLVHRLICERVNGPPPTSRHEASHSCGNGTLGCATPAHLQWKTPKENRKDKQRHGTAWNVGGIKLSANQIRAIRAIGRTKTQRKIAEEFGVSQGSVSLVLNDKTWPAEAVKIRSARDL